MVLLPESLASPLVLDDRVLARIALDLTVYVEGPTEQELDWLSDRYSQSCPNDRLIKYKITELPFWPRLREPVLTASGRAAAAAGVPRPYMQPVRQRIRDGRHFEFGFWDDRSLEDSEGIWFFNCYRIHRRRSGLHAFARIVVPITTDLSFLRAAASEIADNVQFVSGHGGLTFLYDSVRKHDALDEIYPLVRRFWGVDLGDLNVTLPLMRNGIKGVNWITLVGNRFANQPGVNLDELENIEGVQLERYQYGSVIIAGPEPVVGDQNRPDSSLDPYYAVAAALTPIFLETHPDFPSERFIDNGNTLGYIRRFIDPDGWR